MTLVIHQGIKYRQDVLDSAQIILLEMQDESKLSVFSYSGRPSIIFFARRLQQEHEDLSLIDCLKYFQAFLGTSFGESFLDLETGAKK